MDKALIERLKKRLKEASHEAEYGYVFTSKGKWLARYIEDANTLLAELTKVDQQEHKSSDSSS